MQSPREDSSVRDEAIVRNAILGLLRNRRRGASICPSEAARLAFPSGDWRSKMPEVRRVAARMEREGSLVWCQKGERVAPAQARGPIRLGLKTPEDKPDSQVMTKRRVLRIDPGNEPFSEDRG